VDSAIRLIALRYNDKSEQVDHSEFSQGSILAVEMISAAKGETEPFFRDRR
jgi:hypothetical protein